MRKTVNQTHLSGRLYDHKLELRETGPNSKNPGTKFIMGTVDIATDEACLNIVSVHFTYVTATTSKGSANATFSVLSNIIDGKYKSIMSDDKDSAVKLRIDSAIGLNEFYSDRNGTDELVSVKRNEGGFVHVTDMLEEDENVRNTFRADMLITNVSVLEADEERELPERAIVKGAIFDFRGALLPVEFTATNPGAINYYVGLEASSANPVFTCLWGKQISTTIVRKIVEESAFGEDSVREVRNTRKDFVITGGAKEPYEWDAEDSITAIELKEKMAERETYLATIKQRRDEYKASQNAPAAPAGNADFNF